MTIEEAQGLQIRLLYPDGRTEQIVIDADEILIGSGAHCEIRLPPEHAAIEHIKLSLIAGAVHAQARALNPHPTIDGVGFVRTPVLADAVLGVGPVQIRASAIALTDQVDVVRKSARTVSPMTYVAMAIGFPIAIALLGVASHRAEGSPMPQGTPPALWAAPLTQCPQTAREAALAVAIEKLTVADSKRERRPFHVQDGIGAVPSFEVAAACFAAAGQPGASAEAARSGEELRTKMNEDYRVHQMRLEHALTVEDWTLAQKEVKVLRAFTEGQQQAAYVVWLSNLERRLALKLTRKGSSS